MMELTCALVLLIVGSVTAGPHGYGTKGGAVAKADARAVAGAYAGAGSLPLSIPSGSSYSGSFSQSSASSSSSSSSSSSAFTYSGSGAVGGLLPNGNACRSGNCNNGGATGAQGSAGAGSHAYNINAGSLAGGYGVKIPAGNYGHKYSNDNSQDNKDQDCGSQGCLGTNSNSLNVNSAGYGLQSSSDAKATASAGAGNDNRCDSGECGSKAKCSSGNCEAPHISDTSQSNGPNKCTTGKCVLNQDDTGSSSIDNDNNDINVHGPGSTNSKPSYGSGCTDGICDTSPASTSGYDKPALDLTVPKLEPACSGSNCYHSAPGYSPSGQTKAPHISTTYQNDNQLGSVSSSVYGSPSKSTYAHGPLPSYSQKKPAGEAACAPGTPGCGIPAPNSGSFDCTSGNCGANPSAPGHYGPSSGKPSYSHDNAPSVTTSSQACVSGTPGCNTSPPGSKPSDCAVGNCGPSSSGHNYSGIKPIYSHESLPTFSATNPSGADCAPGLPGCATSPSGPHECVSGNCHGYSSSTGYGASSSNKPSYSHGTSVPYSPFNPTGAGCSPGTLGCGPKPKPNYSNGVSPSYSSSIPPCSPGATGCGLTSTAGNSFVVKPSYSYGSLSPNAPLKPPGSPCEPGSPGCTLTVAPSSPDGCTSGNCDEFVPLGGHGVPKIKPPYSQGSPTYFPVKPSGPSCVPGTLGCAITAVPGCVSGNCGVYPTLQGCSPGTPGCSITPSSTLYGALGHPTAGAFMPVSGISAPGYGSAGVGSSLNQGAYGSHGTGSYNKPSSGFSAPGSGSGTYTSGLLPVPVAPGIESSPHLGTVGTGSQAKDKPAYTGGFGGPAGLLKPNEYSAASPTNYGNKPIVSATPATVIAGAFVPVSGIPAPGYGSAGVGPSLNQGAYGSHGTGSYNKPSTGFSAPGSGSGTYTSGLLPVPVAPGIESSPHLGTVGTGSQAKDKPAYTGGFGGPAGLLKPNEYSAASPTNYGNKPIVSATPTTVKPSCVSGICDVQASPSYSHAGSNSGAQAVAGASTTADAVAYNGGFGGPPGFLLPHDNGKVDLKDLPGKHLTGSSHGLHQGADHSSYSNDGSPVLGSIVAHANAAAVSSAGVSTVDKLHSGKNGEYSHGHNNAGGCGGECGSSGAGSGSLGYDGSLAFSKTGLLDGSSNGLATSGAAAKSLASASNGARAFGSSYASSSASAHAGASVKGGYGTW